ncbi:MAG: Mrp/NBP35 family ATP-binding protein [Acidimicrobiales bacterium]|nr:Mrp/NBP35 family ATP-binding protein [Acidimicrobiales bacterium]MCB1015031.1 Mrp/NBP35 family ATP-binding protein [Acidimicrobiales bacterium]MCB9373066.1 Mrp/NBP35 family ATP-binding protein [Microthrixaceae bacterium]
MPDQLTAIRAALDAVVEPELERTLDDLGLVRGVAVDGGRVHTVVALTTPENPTAPELAQRITDALGGVDGVSGVDIEFSVLTDDEREGLRRRFLGDPRATAGSTEAHGHAEGRAVPFAQPGSTTRALLIASGKGGVGKSSVSTNLAVALAARGHRTAIVDADVWGFSIPRMLGIHRPPTLIDEMLVPPRANGVSCISMGFFADESQPVIWRGPMLHKALEQFLTDVYWGDPDFLVVDLPPGTGDISISLAGFLPQSEVYVVTTPQLAAERVAQRAAFMAQKVGLEVKGVIENLSWFTGDDGTRYELFGAGGGQALADRLGVPLVGQVPLVPALREGGDEGEPVAALDPDRHDLAPAVAEAQRVFAEMAATIAVDLAPTKRRHPGLKIV